MVGSHQFQHLVGLVVGDGDVLLGHVPSGLTLAARPLFHLVLAIIIITGQMPNVGDILRANH